MTLELDTETRLALVDEIKRRIPPGEQRRFAHAIAERAEKMVGAICGELNIGVAELVDAARRAARPRSRPAPDRHPAWQELGAAAPWVDRVPGLQEGMDTLRRELDAHAQRVVWLVGPAGSGKSARLCRAQQEKIGQIVADRVPDEAEPNAVWLVDEPVDPPSWIAGAARCSARLVIATSTAKQRSEGQTSIELAPWTRTEVECFLDQLDAARGSGCEALDAVDLELIADKLAALGRAWTPLDLGHVIRLFVDEPELLERDANDRELRIRSALHQMLRRTELSPDREKLWSTHGRQALALAAATAIRNSDVGPLGEDALREALAALVGARVGGPHGEPLRVILERARKKNGKNPLKLLETWAQAPSSDDLIELLVETGAWRRTGDAMLIPTDGALALTFAAESLDEDWMWRRLYDTLADPGWATARLEWASRLARVQERIDELLATNAAVHVGAIELATALVAFTPDSPRPDQVERAVSSAVQLLDCPPLTRLGLGPRHDLLREAVRVASRRHRRTLPPVTTASTPDELAERCTESTRRVLGAAESLAEGEPESLRSIRVSQEPAWVTYATLLPWQALPALQDPDGRSALRFMRVAWEAVIMDHAADGDDWARAVATGDVEDILETVDLVSSRGLLRALGRWPGPSMLQRHDQALAMVLRGWPSRDDGGRSRLHSKLVRAIADLVRRHPERPLPDVWLLRTHEQLWREALDQAAAVSHLEAWFAGEQRELARSADPDDPLPRLDSGADRLLRLGEVLHCHGVRTPLLALLEKAEPPGHAGPRSVSWELGLGAADALLRRRDAEALRSMLDRRDAPAEAVECVLIRNDDEATEAWIADTLGERYHQFLEGIAARPERREAAKRWALDLTHPHRRHAAAAWLIEHPTAGESEHVWWLLTSQSVAHGRLHARAGLVHPDEEIRRAAAALLQRALGELRSRSDPELDLEAVAGCFGGARREGDRSVSLIDLTQYIVQVNASDQHCGADSLRTVIDLVQRYLATAPDDQSAWFAHRLCSSLATAARRVRLAALASWVRAPLGDHFDPSAALVRLDQVRQAIAQGILDGDAAEIESDVLQALADTAGTVWACRAHSILLERNPLTVTQLITEWARATDAVLVDAELATARWCAVQALLRRRAPRELAHALADRLLTLPPELRRLGIPQISQVAMLDAREAARLSTLFD